MKKKLPVTNELNLNKSKLGMAVGFALTSFTLPFLAHADTLDIDQAVVTHNISDGVDTYTVDADEVTLNNNGTIDSLDVNNGADDFVFNNYANKEVTNSSLSDSTAISYADDLDGELSNSGLIQSNGEDNTYQSAINVEDRISGDLINGAETDGPNGGIYSYSYNIGAETTSVAIDAHELTGSIENSGIIYGEAASDSNYSYAYGIRLEEVGSSGVIINNEFLNDDVIDGGRILGEAQGNGSTYVSAYGLAVTSSGPGTAEMSGSITNNGFISGESSYGDDVEARGIYIERLSGVLTNSASGVVLATAYDGEDYSAAYGIQLQDITQNGELNNAGQIVALSDNYDGYAHAYGLKVNNNLSGTVLNEGLIYAAAYSGTLTDSYASSYGLDTSSLNGTFTNASSGEDQAVVMGEAFADTYETGAVNGTWDFTSNAVAAGVNIGEIETSGVLSNEGLISGESTADSRLYYQPGATTTTGLADDLNNLDTRHETFTESEGYGVSVSDLNGQINNSGLILGEASSYSESVYDHTISTNQSDTVNDGSNTAELNVEADEYARAYAKAYGLRVDEDAGGSIRNEGGIIGVALSDARAVADINVNASADNNYSVEGDYEDDEAYATADSYSYAYAQSDAWGIKFDSDSVASQSVINENGALIGAYARAYADVSAVADATSNADGFDSANSYSEVDAYSYAYAYGISYDGDDLSGVLTNRGSIVAEATAITVASSTGSASADLGEDDNYTNKNLENDNVYAYAYAYGINVDRDLNGVVNNESTGLIEVNAFARSSNDKDYASAYGIKVGSDLYGSINNAGEILVAAEAHYSSAYGIYIDDNIEGSITNSGLIEVDSIGVETTAKAIYAQELNGNITITETGALSVSAGAGEEDTSDLASAQGVHILEDVSYGSAIVNSGSIDVSSSVEGNMDSWASSHGILIGEAGNNINFNEIEMRGQITNNGTIESLANTYGEDAYASSYGILVNAPVTLGGSVINNGEIIAQAYSSDSVDAYGSAYDDAYAVGLFVEELDESGELINNGTIRGMAGVTRDEFSDLGFSVVVRDGNGTVDNNGNLFGSLELGAYEDAFISLDNSGMAGITNSGYGYVSGDYTQNTRGLIGLGVNSDTDYATFEVDGVADFSASNAIAINVGSPHDLEGGDLLDSALTMNSGLTGASGFRMIDNNLALNFEAEDGLDFGEGADWDINVVSTGLTTINSAQLDVGNRSGLDAGRILQDGMDYTRDAFHALDTNWSPMHRALFELGSLSTATQVSNAVEKTLPALSGATNQVNLDVTRTMTNMLSNRMLSTAGMSAGNGYITNGNVWVKPFGGSSDQGSNKGVSGYDGNVYGVAGGIDWDVSDSARLGVAFAYARSTMDSDGVADQKAVSKNAFGSVYGSYMLTEGLQLNAQAGYGKLRNQNNRRVDFAGINYNARSNYDGDVATFGIGLSHLFNATDSLAMVTSLRTDYAKVDTDGYTEKGQDSVAADALNLRVNGYKTDELIVSLKEEFQYKVTDSAKLFASVGVGYDTIDDKSKMTANYVGGHYVDIGNFKVNPMDRSSTIYTGALGLDIANMGGWIVTGRYDFTGRSDYTNHLGSIRVMLPF